MPSLSAPSPSSTSSRTGRRALAQRRRTFPGVSSPESVVRSRSVTARSSQATCQSFLTVRRRGMVSVRRSTALRLIRISRIHSSSSGTPRFRALGGRGAVTPGPWWMAVRSRFEMCMLGWKIWLRARRASAPIPRRLTPRRAPASFNAPMRIVRPGLAALVFATLLVVGIGGAGPLPPIGPLLDPWRGVWAAASVANLPRRGAEPIPGVTDTVRVVYDDRAVPHIFAGTELDAYRALGYVVARDRLFQLELQTRATAGTLTELLGPAALEADRSQRSLGLAWSAEREWAATDSASIMARAATAYAQGVNAWIDGLGPRDLPLEYHLLRARPLRWKPQYTLYLMKRMGYTLAYDTFERQRDRLTALIGEAAANALFPAHSPIQEPIQPGPGRHPRFDFTPLPPPQPPRLSRAIGGDRGRSGAMGEWSGEAEVGSNNWAVRPKRSASGSPLLAPHPP